MVLCCSTQRGPGCACEKKCGMGARPRPRLLMGKPSQAYMGTDSGLGLRGREGEKGGGCEV